MTRVLFFVNTITEGTPHILHLQIKSGQLWTQPNKKINISLTSLLVVLVLVLVIGKENRQPEVGGEGGPKIPKMW